MHQLVQMGSLREFFRLLVGEVAKRRQLALAEVTEFYLVNLLSEYAEVDKLFTEEVGGRREAEPLAVLYHRALLQAREARMATLRRLGDLSLYTAGYFHSSLEDRLVGPDYYVSMGQTAYGIVAQMSGSGAFAIAYFELQQKFQAVMEVLEEIALRGQAASGPQGQFELLERWRERGDARIAGVLADVGVLPPSRLPN